MENLTNKRFGQFGYTNRYTSVPFYYDTNYKRDVSGIGQQMSLNNT